MGSAQLDPFAFEERTSPAAGAPGSRQQAAVTDADALDLRRQAAARIAAHRERRAQTHRHAALPDAAPPVGSRHRHNPIVEAVAERFAHSPSYRAVLAEQAQRAMEQAARDAEAAAAGAHNAVAEAQIAQRNADAIAQAQQQLLDELNLWDAPQQFTAEAARARSGARPAAAPAAKVSGKPVQEPATHGLTVRLYEDLGPKASLPAPPAVSDAPSFDEALALDEEIAFRQAPVFEPFSVEPTPLPARLLEFPRELVAARKARPRLAEGPLREDAEPRSPQLRIFEVEPEQISTVPAAPSATPEWASIHLDAQPATMPADPSAPSAPPVVGRAAAAAAAPALLPSMLPPQTAPLELRLMAISVDLLLVTSAVLAFIAAAAQTIARFGQRIPSGVAAAAAIALVFAILWPLYQVLFFTFSDQTPGMRYARVGLCTFTDENPTRRAMRSRIWAQLVALCPFGLGFLWALLDEDGLGWHDRISRMYQRAY